MNTTRIVGILNVTEDSFSDGGRYLDPTSAIDRARRLLSDGAGIIDLGPAASNPSARPVDAREEIRRLDPLIRFLKEVDALISVDSFLEETQRYAIASGIAYLNDIQGFPDPKFYPELAAAGCKLIVMHAVQGRGIATQVDVPAEAIWDRVLRFFEQRVSALESAGVARERMVLDPGMGYFLSNQPEASLRVLANLSRLKRAFDLPILLSVSRKSFLRQTTGRGVSDVGSATLAAELYAAMAGADYIRTHEPAPLRDALLVISAIASQKERPSGA